MTNIALALMREPELPRLVKRFVIMGGAYAEPGNVTPAAEFNIWHDPEAARIVFRSFGGVGAAPVIAIGLDVTRKTDHRRRATSRRSRRASPASRMARRR